MLQYFAFVFVLMLFIPDAYIYWLYVKKWLDNSSFSKLHSQLYKMLWWLPSVILAAGFIGARYIGTQNPMSERQSIKVACPKFLDWVESTNFASKWWPVE